MHQNTSDFYEQRFSTRFTGEEPFLSDHVVGGQRMLPGSAYLEMARAAVSQAVGGWLGEGEGIRLQQVGWVRPLIVGDKPVEIHMGLAVEKDEAIRFDVYRETDEGEEVVYSEGRAELLTEKAPPLVDLSRIQQACGQKELSREAVYTAFANMGIQYGESHRGIERIYVGQEEVLARLTLASPWVHGGLHPGMVDAAIQAGIGLQEGFDQRQPSVPFAMEEVAIYRETQEAMWAWVRREDGQVTIVLCDDVGRICLEMKGLATRIMNQEIETNAPTGYRMLAPVWERIRHTNDQKTVSSSHPVVFTGKKADGKTAIISQQYPKARVLHIDAGTTIEGIIAKFKSIEEMDELIWYMPELPVSSVADEGLIAAQEQTVIALFRVVKALLRLGYGQNALQWTIVTGRAQQVHPQEAIQPAQSALYGFAGSLAKEYPRWQIRLLDLNEGDDLQPLTQIHHLPEKMLAFREGSWYHQRLVQVEQTAELQMPYKKGGVYVVIGGAGGLGEVWSEHVIRHYQAKVVWIGRREKDEVIRSKISRLAALGPAPDYIAADAANRQSLEEAYQQIKEKYGEIQGVIHSAIVLRDQRIAQMDEETFRAALTAKVNVSVRIAQVFADESLDFVLFFSSIQSFATSAGQSNYAAGCTFKDAFALAMEREWTCPVKIMNWGYWGSVGVVAEEIYQQKMAQAGIGSIEGPEGMAAVDFLLSQPCPQLAYINTLRPLHEQEIGLSETIAIYPEEINTCMANLIQEQPAEEDTAEQAILAITQRMEQGQPLLVKLLWGQLQKAGLFQNKQGSLTELTLGLQPNYRRWMKETATIFEEHKYLSWDGQAYSVLEDPVDNMAIWQEWEQFKQTWEDEKGMQSHLTLIEATLRKLPDILTGQVTATDILFPNSSIELVEGIYKQNAVADYYNQRLASILVNYLQQRQRHQKPVRILEIGAGTGGSTAEVLKRIQPYHDSIDEYAYTDISKLFLLFAEKYFGDWKNRITYRMFDVTKPVVEQGIDPGGYDVVIASNVLHATPVLRETLRNTKALLKKNGLLLLIETTTHTLFNHLTFGLLDGWWLYEDEAWRIPGSPLVTVDQWERVLASEGFLTMVVPNANGQQHIILAESNGVIRQKKPTDEHPQKVEQSQQVEKPVPIVAAQPIRLGESLHTACVDYMKHLAGDILRLSAEQIDSAEPLERYGFDSILVTQMTSLLRKDFADISSTLLFEYQTLDDLADYLIKNHYQRAKDLLTFNPETDDQPVSEAPPSRPVKKKFRRKARSLRSLVSHGSQTGSNLMDVAIIGIAGRYPKANNIHEYWQLLKSGQQAVTSIPKERWDWQQYYDEEPGKPGYMYTKWGGFINGIDQFDSYFFHLSPAEAKRMDPQERLFLETCYESIADAGYTPSNLSKDRKVGVFVGAMNGHYPPGASYWSIANRVSYILNFQGPSLAVDSACSSSLTAIHLALESLYSGTSTCAVAGGVNLIVHPDHFLKLSAMTMLSPGDTCRPFSQQADGIVDSEGIGAVVLKPLEQAEVDGDHIYGVIKGSTINAGGKTNGYTVPNPHSQAKLIIEALERTKLDARTISYIEAHGTGTALGDPIEIKGLTTAFEKYTHERQFCAIGSVKSNIGHSESAAGIAGLTKVLLQLKHHQLVPSLHAEELNTRIDFSQTPFAVQQKLADWKRPVIYKGGKMQEYPRRAGISSFGAGGANAHLLIEEYIPRNDQRASLSITPDQPAIIVLSAKTEEQLRQQAIQLLTSIKQQAFTDDHLADIAYTLQIGREVMEERLAITVSSIEVLRQRLDAYIQQVEDPHRISGRCSSRDVTSVIPEKSIIQWIETGAYQPLMEAWVNGGAIDWHLLYQNGKPSRISLPAYPFARDRYWITEVKRDIYQDSAIHPLVHQNISDVKGLKFKTKLNEHAFYFQDHAIDSIGVLPGVAYLEMASTAAKAVMSEQGKTDVCLKNVIWSKPFKQQDAQSPLIIGIVPQHNQLMAFTIYQPIDGEETIYCEGEITLGAFTQAADGLDLSLLQEQCQQRVLTSEECYQAFRSMGIVYGPHFQGIEKIYVGQRQALAKIHLPVCTADKQDAYTLHPGLLDASIQSAVGLTLSDAGQGLALPFAMDELVLIGDCLKAEWSFVRQRDEGRGITKMDIDICDEQGDCVLLIKGLTLKSKPVQDAILFYPHWEEKVVAPSAPSFKEENGHVIIYGAEPKIAQKISDQLPDEVCHVIPYDGDHFDIAGQFVRDALQVFHIIQGILKAKPTHVVPVQILLFNQSDNPFGKALSGMLQTAHLENPYIIGQCIMLDGDMESDHVLTILHDNRQVMATPQVAYRGSQKRHALRWKEVPPSEKKESLLWKEGGVYLITGGNGGLAKIIIQEIALHIQRGVVILVGRSQPTKEMQQWLNEWQQSELKVIYRSLDVTDRQAVQRCIKDIKGTYGDLNGIIHGAGVTDDHFMIQKKATQFTQVLAPKVAGVVHLDEASQDCHLDFFVIFSSITGVMGNIGQADYATANAFVDQYAYYRNSLVKSQKRQGRTFSINWPLWEDGGMQVTSQQQRQWKNDTGMVALKPEAGIRAFYQAWASPWQQVMVLAGDRDKLCRFVGEQEEEQENDATFYLTLIEQIASNELSEKEFMQLLQSHHRQVKTL
ncbi:SDR family NAD(P)-dependent oxidoreductase [Bacillus spizizenii]|uniref:SDR family NAD(P)-dependent oxidoreductase n=2 Tax=Bacillus spizizenii TaxID=96241 RepID=UPI001ED9060F|nr:SDR family NAD(P)-dependent oxidoreductase [Bacillus spizizenii]